MEEEYGLFGREGDANITLYRDEVDMTLPFAESDQFSIVNTTPIFPEDFTRQTTFYRGGQDAETFFRGEDSGDSFAFYGSARRMQYVTMEEDGSFPGSDLITGTEDDGRSLMIAYETIPFRLEGLEDGAKLPIIGDNFSFTALPSNPWNLASSLRIDSRLNFENLMSGDRFTEGANEIAQSLVEFGDGKFIEKISLLNSGMGSKLSDLSDNLDHQESIETLLLEQRGAVSSVNIDEEVANLMRFQRSFQASSRVLSTLDNMLELVVMGLIR
jgi:flagellar hook-associated protein FlgK